MSKYEKLNSNVELTDVKNILVDNEKIIWEGKPKKSAFVFNKVMTMLPLALIWLLFDGGIITMMIVSGEMGKMIWFIIPFFALHLMPVWIWLSNVLTANKKWQNTKYIITDKRIIIQSGFIGLDYQTVYYKEISKVNLKVGMIDKMLKVGDIYFSCKGGMHAFLDVEDCYTIYPKIQKVVLDMQTDMEFPNNLRPDKNDGYNTDYTGGF